MATQRVIGVEHRAHAIRQLIAPFLTASTRDTIGKRLRKQRRQHRAVHFAASPVEPFQELLATLLPARLLARKRHAEVGIARARRFLQNRRQFRRCRLFAVITGADQHRRQTGVVAKPRHFLPRRAQPLAIQRIQHLQQPPGCLHVGRRGKVQPV